MLKIKPIEDKAQQAEYCSRCSVTYLPDALSYSCHEEETFIGVCQFGISAGNVYIYDLATEQGITDNGALFIMGRAALNFADLAGFHDAYYPNPVDERIAKMIGFKQNDDGVWYMDLRGFFESPCSCDSK